MAGRIRAVLRLTAVIVMTALLVAPRLVLMLLVPVAPRLERRLRRPFVLAWGYLAAPLMGMRLRVLGDIPKPPFFLVSNHLSYVDNFVLLGLTGGAFVARHDVRSWPGANIVALAANTIYINRTRMRDTLRVGGEIRRELDRGMGIVVYPEARTSPGREVRPFKSGLLEPAIEAGIPAHYCTIHYETFPGEPPASEVVCWYTSIGFLPHAMRLLALKGFTATVTFGPEPIRAEDRKALAQSLHEAVVRQFTPVD
ncbi:MAG: lysophospholipid acyltransferase family protein [FCB group bacterium]|jgi:1-acyl-sn-glycerol-3-phosphate acyltransferase|nr:lysophospholipid acyltransferase family protein [FCB group bacterium]